MTDPIDQTVHDTNEESIPSPSPPYTELDYTKYLIFYGLSLLGVMFAFFILSYFFGTYLLPLTTGGINSFLFNFFTIMIVANIFSHKYKRVMTETERKKLSSGSVAITTFYILLDFIAFSFFIKNPESQGHFYLQDGPDIWAAILSTALFCFLSYFMHYWLYGWFNQHHIGAFEKKNSK